MHRRVLAGVATLLLCTLTATSQAPPPSTSPAVISSDPAPDLSVPLPDIQTLLTRVRARYDALESLRKNYICTMSQVADEFSSDGSKKTHTDQYQAFYVGSTLVLQHNSHDGKPLSDEDAKKEQQRVDKLVAKLKSHESKSPKDEIRLSASGLLKIATFTDPRRELLNGRPTLVFDYKGDPHAQAHSLGDEIMRQLAGTLWVDERDEAVVRLNGTLQENFPPSAAAFWWISKKEAGSTSPSHSSTARYGSPPSSQPTSTVAFCCSKASTATRARPSPTTENLQLQSPFCQALKFWRTVMLLRPGLPPNRNRRPPPRHPHHRNPNDIKSLQDSTQKEQGQPLLSLLISRSVPTSLKKV